MLKFVGKVMIKMVISKINREKILVWIGFLTQIKAL